MSADMELHTITTYQSGVIQSAAYRNLHKQFSGLLKEHDLTCMQWFVAGTILDAGQDGIKATDLAKKLRTGLPFTTKIINQLEAKGIVERRDDPSDSRVSCVTIAPSFSGSCAGIEQQLRQKLRKTIYKNISPDELRTYIRVLYKLSELE